MNQPHEKIQLRRLIFAILKALARKRRIFPGKIRVYPIGSWSSDGFRVAPVSQSRARAKLLSVFEGSRIRAKPSKDRAEILR